MFSWLCSFVEIKIVGSENFTSSIKDMLGISDYDYVTILIIIRRLVRLRDAKLPRYPGNIGW